MRTYAVRVLFVCLLTLLPMRMFAVGWTPTDAGLAVNFQSSDQFLLSVWIDLNSNGTEEAGEEFFVCHYPSYTGGRFKYKAAHELRLVPQDAGATVPSEASVWTIDAPLTRVKNKVDYALGGISYTMWSSFGYTLMSGTPSTTSAFKFLGCLSNDKTYSNLCDVVFVVPNVHEFPGHIACSSASKSEIVVPIRRNGEVIAVLDIDSADYNTFDAIDQKFLEQIIL